jgi:hypothetical protein
MADGQRMICKFNRSAGTNIIELKETHLTLVCLCEVELRFVQNEGREIRQFFTLDFVQGLRHL